MEGSRSAAAGLLEASWPLLSRGILTEQARNACEPLCRQTSRFTEETACFWPGSRCAVAPSAPFCA